MKVDIFSFGGSDRKVAVMRHILTVLTAILINLASWFMLVFGKQIYVEDVKFITIVIGVISACLETVVVMEASFAFSRLVIRAFINVRCTFGSMLLKNILLLVGVVLISAAISFVYTLLHLEPDGMFMNIFFCNVLVAYFLTSVFFMSFLASKCMKEQTLAQQVTIDKLKLKTDNHFVFNSFAILESLIQTNPESALEFTASMSGMYRYIVSKGDTKVVPLQEELMFMDEYKKNLKSCYGNIGLVLDDALGELISFIPPLTLQGLVENAVKYNRHSSKDHLVIRIFYDRDKECIVVSNNRLPMSSSVESSRTGLETLNLRYNAICGRGIKVKESKDEFIVSLPIIKQDDLYESHNH